MTTELSTHVVKINLKDIVDNVLNKDYWEKKWCVFDYNNVTIEIKLSSINIARNRVSLDISVADNMSTSMFYKSHRGTVDFPLDRFEHDAFQKTVLGTIHRLIEEHELRYAINTSGYDELQKQENEYKEKSISKLEDELDELGITHEGVREAYIDNNYETINLTSDYIHSFKRNYMLIVHNQVDAMVEFI